MVKVIQGKSPTSSSPPSAWLDQPEFHSWEFPRADPIGVSFSGHPLIYVMYSGESSLLVRESTLNNIGHVCERRRGPPLLWALGP